MTLHHQKIQNVWLGPLDSKFGFQKFSKITYCELEGLKQCSENDRGSDESIIGQKVENPNVQHELMQGFRFYSSVDICILEVER